MKRQLILLVATALIGFSLAQTDPHHPDQTPGSTPSTQLKTLPAIQAPGTTNNPDQPGMSQGQSGMMADPQGMMNMMQGMMGQMGLGMGGQGLMMLEGAPFEQAFLSMLIPHHRTAVGTARDILGKTQDTQIRGWANAIIRDQEREIGQMRTLLSALGGTNLAAQRAMTQGGMGQNSNANMMQNSSTDTMMQTPQASASAERAFLETLIPHHLQAIQMATLALQKTRNPVILKLASDIVVAQAQEVYQMRLKLASLR